MSTHTQVRESPVLTARDTRTREAPVHSGGVPARADNTRALVAASLAVGVFLGYGGNFLPTTPQILAHALSSVGLVIGCTVLAFALLRQGREVAAAGFLILAGAEIVMWSNGSDGDLAIVAFAAAVMFYAPALLLISIPRLFPIWSRAAGALAAIPFAVHGVQFLLGNTPSPDGVYAIAGFTLMSIAVIGWIVTVLRPAPTGYETNR